MVTTATILYICRGRSHSLGALRRSGGPYPQNLSQAARMEGEAACLLPPDRHPGQHLVPLGAVAELWPGAAEQVLDVAGRLPSKSHQRDLGRGPRERHEGAGVLDARLGALAAHQLQRRVQVRKPLDDVVEVRPLARRLQRGRHPIAGRRGRLTGQQRPERRGVHSVRHRCPRVVKHGTHEVQGRHGVVHHAALQDARARYDQGHAGRDLPRTGFAKIPPVAQMLAVVGGHHDEGVTEEVPLLQKLYQPADQSIEATYQAGVLAPRAMHDLWREQLIICGAREVNG
mmetsp:Transcript_10410/g.27771  ORF Transcript_10410/g.27771 Transcript_10410/m.27771 type:complete len:286 (-) Transcript_10410:604-1461(-)